MGHLTESTLARYALDAAIVHDAAAVERHLGACAECRELLQEIGQFDAALAEPDAWPPAGESFEQLRSFAAAVAEEDLEAERLLKDFDGVPAATFVWADLPGRAEYHTGGVVRALCKRAKEMSYRDPRYALELAEVARAIAAELRDERYPAPALHEWRAEAWKERATALFLLGRFAETLQTLELAQQELDALPYAGIGQVAVLYIRGSVLHEQEQYDEADRLFEQAATAALHLGDIERYMAAVHMRGAIRYRKRDFAAAVSVFESGYNFGEKTGQQLWIARESVNLANCYIELGRLAEARRCADTALRIFTTLRLHTEVTRTRWAIARLAFAEGNRYEAIYQLRSTIAEMSRLEMLTDAALAAVHLSEMLCATGRHRDIPQLLNGVVQTFTNAGKLTGALTALAYLKEAASGGRLTSDVALHVSRYLSKVDRQPALLFAPPAPSV